MGAFPLSLWLVPGPFPVIQLRDWKGRQQIAQASSIDEAGSKVPWHEEIGKSFLTLIYPSHLLARPSFFFFFNLDVVDITSEILLLALQVCLSAKTLPPGSSFFPLKCKLGRGPQKVVPDPCH